MNDPVNYVDLWGLCGSDGVVFKQYIPTQGIEEKISGTLLPNSNYIEKTQNQNKVQKAWWGEASSVEKQGEVSLEAEVGVYSVSSELNESYPIIGKAQIDLLSANFNTSFTDGGLGLGVGINAVSISGEVGFQKMTNERDIKVSISGSLGLQAGGEFELDFQKGSFIFDLAFIFGGRIEIYWGEKNEN